MKLVAPAIFAALLLTSCGAKVPVRPLLGHELPQKAATAATVPTAQQLMSADTQARPNRSEEQLNRSEKRREDPFDLPPTR